MKQGIRKRFEKGMALGLMAVLMLGACEEKNMENTSNVTEPSDVLSSEAVENDTKGESMTPVET